MTAVTFAHEILTVLLAREQSTSQTRSARAVMTNHAVLQFFSSPGRISIELSRDKREQDEMFNIHFCLCIRCRIYESISRTAFVN